MRKGQMPDVITLRYYDMYLSARKQDWTAVREVLIDDEYVCIDGLFDSSDSPKILDLGANVGCFALRAFKLSPNVSVVSIEAAKDTADVLRHNQERNPSLSWQVIHGAVWRNDGPLSLERTNNSTGHRVSNNNVGEQLEGFSLETILKCVGWRHVDLIKMDIEGAEAEVIPGSEDILRNCDYLIIEIHSDRIDG